MLNVLNVKTEAFVYIHIYFRIKPLTRFHFEGVPFFKWRVLELGPYVTKFETKLPYWPESLLAF